MRDTQNSCLIVNTVYSICNTFFTYTLYESGFFLNCHLDTADVMMSHFILILHNVPLNQLSATLCELVCLFSKLYFLIIVIQPDRNDNL